MRACIAFLIACGGSQSNPTVQTRGAACIAAGSYLATWDSSAAEVTAHGVMEGNEAWCKDFAQEMLEKHMPRATIDFDGGALHVGWPRPMTVRASGGCGFEISGPVQIKVAFQNAKGVGTAELLVDETHDPEEGSCTARGVKVSLERE